MINADLAALLKRLERSRITWGRGLNINTGIWWDGYVLDAAGDPTHTLKFHHIRKSRFDADFAVQLGIEGIIELTFTTSAAFREGVVDRESATYLLEWREANEKANHAAFEREQQAKLQEARKKFFEG